MKINIRDPLFWIAGLPIFYIIADNVYYFIHLLFESGPLSSNYFGFLFSVVFFPIYWGYIILGVLSALGIYKNRMWGIWIAILNIGYNLLISVLNVPDTNFQIFLYAINMILMIYWYSGDKKIRKIEEK